MSEAASEELRARAERLRYEIAHHARMYYELDAPEIQDHEYDALCTELSDIEQAHPELADAGSPTRRIGGAPRSEFKQVVRQVPMQSLENALDIEELHAFLARSRDALSGDELSWVCEPKLDGLAVSLIYEDGALTTASTRGDGITGEDVTDNVRTISSLPQRLSSMRPGTFEVRGEVCMSRDDFAELNRAREERGEYLFANPRNAAAGSLRQLDSRVTASRRLKIFLYHVRDAEAFGIQTQHEMLRLIESEGLPVHGHDRICRSTEEIERCIEDWGTARHDSPINTDGMVVKLNELSLRGILGSTSKAPKWAIAFKYPPEEKRTKVLDIEITVGRTGALTPTAVLEPVILSGTTVRRASLHNQDEIDRKDIRIGDTVWVHKAGEIIPEVLRVDEGSERGAVPYAIPAVCPACGSRALRLPGEAVLRCQNRSCPAQLKEGVLHFVSRQCMDIDGIGEKLADQLVDRGIIKSFADIYDLTQDDIVHLDRMAERSAAKLLSAIDASRGRSFDAVLNALGIRNVGKKTASDIASRFADIDALMSASEDELARIDGVGPIVAASIRNFFEDEHNREIIRRLREAGIQMRGSGMPHVDRRAASFADRRFVFTGELARMSRPQAEAAAEQLGAKTSAGVSRKTDVVVAGRAAGSKLLKAQTLGIEIWDEERFVRELDEAHAEKEE